MRFLIVNETFYPDQAAAGVYATELAVALQAAGHEVSILTGCRGYLDHSQEYAAGEVWQDIVITRVRSWLKFREHRLGRVAYALGLCAAMAARYCKLPKVDVVLLMSAPPLVGCFFPLLMNTQRTLLVQWLMDMNPEQAFRAGWLSRHSIPGRILTTLFRRGALRSKQVFVLDSYMKTVLEKIGIPSSKIELLPLWGDQAGVESITIKDAKARLGIPHESFVVMYAGNHSLCHPLNTLLEVAHRLQAFPEYQFYFVGGGPRKAEVTEFIERHTLTNCVSMDYVPREQLSEVLSAADLHVVTMGEEYVGVVHPSKVYPLLHLKKPFVYVGSQDSALGNLLLHADLDWQVDHGDVEGFMTVLERVKAGMDSQTERILQGLSQTYRKQNSLEKLLSFF